MEHFIGEIRIFTSNERLPAGWHVCDGTRFEKARYPQLFSILINQFGGDGTTPYFSLPDLRGRLPLCADAFDDPNPTYTQGGKGGALTTALTLENMPAHGHTVNVRNADDADNETMEKMIIGMPTDNQFGPASDKEQVDMKPEIVGKTGDAVPISNIQPVLALVFAIAMTGVVPIRT